MENEMKSLTRIKLNVGFCDYYFDTVVDEN